MGSATLVFTMGRFLGLGTLAIFTACLIVLVNSNVDHNLKELGQVEGLPESLLKINHNELRWKRAAKEGKKSKGLKKGKKKRTSKTGGKGKRKGNGNGNKTKKKKKDGKKWKNKKNKGKKKKKCNKKNGCKKGNKPKATKQPKVDSKQSCPIDQAADQCLQNAIESLVYEQKQLTNFLK